MQRHRSHGPEVQSVGKVLPPAWHLGLRSEQTTVPPRLAPLSASHTAECDFSSREGRHWASSDDRCGAACRPTRTARSASRHAPPPLEPRCPTPPRAPPNCAVPASFRVRQPPGQSVRSARHRRLSPLPLESLPLTARNPGSQLHKEQLEKGRRRHEGTLSSTCASSSSLTPRTSSSNTEPVAHQINPCKPIVSGCSSSSCHSELTEVELQAAEEAICAETATEMLDSVLSMSEVGNHSHTAGSTCEEVKEEVHGKRPQEKGTAIPIDLLLPDEESDDSDSDMDMVAGMRAASRVRQNANFAATISFIVGQHFNAAAPKDDVAKNQEVDSKEAVEADAERQQPMLAGQTAQSSCMEERRATQSPLAGNCSATATPHQEIIAVSSGQCEAGAASARSRPGMTARNRTLISEVFQAWSTCGSQHPEEDGSVPVLMACPNDGENAPASGNAHESMDLQISVVENDVSSTSRGIDFHADQFAGLVLSRAIDCGSHASTCVSPSSAACTSRPQSMRMSAGCRGNGSRAESTRIDAGKRTQCGSGESQVTPAGHESSKLIASGCVLWEVSHGEPLPFDVARPTSAASSGMKTPHLR